MLRTIDLQYGRTQTKSPIFSALWTPAHSSQTQSHVDRIARATRHAKLYTGRTTWNRKIKGRSVTHMTTWDRLCTGIKLSFSWDLVGGVGVCGLMIVHEMWSFTRCGRSRSPLTNKAVPRRSLGVRSAALRRHPQPDLLNGRAQARHGVDGEPDALGHLCLLCLVFK